MAEASQKDTDPKIKKASPDHDVPVRLSTRSDSSKEQGLSEPSRDGLPAEPQSEDIQRVATIGEDFSVLTVGQKKLIIVAASFASLFSPMATAIYCK